MKRSIILVLLGVFVVGLVLGLVLMRLMSGGLRAWGLGGLIVLLLGIAIPLGYIILIATGASQSIRSREPEIVMPSSATRVEGEPVRRILVTAGGGPHARLALRLAADIAAREKGAMVSLLRVVDSPNGVLPAREALVQMATDALGPEGAVDVKVTVDSSVVGGILAEARQGYDLLVLGASEERALHKWLMGAIPDLVAARAPCAVLLVKANRR